MLVKKKPEESESKKAYKKRVLALLYPEEHSLSASSVDQRGDGSSAASESQNEMIPSESKTLLVVTEQLQPEQKVYSVSIPPADFDPSSYQEGFQDQTRDERNSSSDEQEPLNGDLSSRRNRRKCKRRKMSHDQRGSVSKDGQQGSTVSKCKVTETVEATELVSKNKKRKLKKKLKNAERKHNASEFVYKAIHEMRTDKVCSETHNTDDDEL